VEEEAWECRLFENGYSSLQMNKREKGEIFLRKVPVSSRTYTQKRAEKSERSCPICKKLQTIKVDSARGLSPRSFLSLGS
jgi:hypothetical protein